jgi:hypothetical protein
MRYALCLGLLVLTGACDKTIKRVAGHSYATRHLPEACEAVARIDFQAVLRAPGVKEHLAAHDGDAKAQEANKSGRSDKLFRFLQESGLDPKHNVHEIAVCLSDASGSTSGPKPSRASFLIALGGALGGTDLLPAMEKFAPPTTKFERRTVDGRPALVREGQFWAQAKDGVILFTDNEALLKAALPDTSKRYETLAPRKGDVTLVATRRVFETLGGQAGKYPHPILQGLGQAQRLSATLSLTERRVDAVVGLQNPSDAQALSDRWNGLLKPFHDERSKASLAQHLPKPLLESLSQTSVHGKESQVDIKLQLPPSAFEQLFHTAAVLSGLESMPSAGSESPH